MVTQPTPRDITTRSSAGTAGNTGYLGDSKLYTLARLEETGLSIMLRESGLAFFSSLTLHSLAMAFVVGINLALAFSLIGVIPSLLHTRFRPFLTLHWWAVGLIFLSGIALLLAYPAKALTNPVFYLKFFALSAGLLVTWKLQQSESYLQAAPTSMTTEFVKARGIGMVMLLCWMLTIGAGRFLAYTNSVLLASRHF